MKLLPIKSMPSVIAQINPVVDAHDTAPTVHHCLDNGTTVYFTLVSYSQRSNL